MRQQENLALHRKQSHLRERKPCVLRMRVYVGITGVLAMDLQPCDSINKALEGEVPCFFGGRALFLCGAKVRSHFQLTMMVGKGNKYGSCPSIRERHVI